MSDRAHEALKVPMDLRILRPLIADWFRLLARGEGWELGTGREGNIFVMRLSKDRRIRASPVDRPPFLDFVASDASDQERVNRLMSEAWERARAGDVGGIQWYTETCREVPVPLSPISPRSLITGWWRLGPHVLLKFSQEDVENGSKDSPSEPRASVRVHIAAPGPMPGYLSSQEAHGYLETVVAICGFALVRPLGMLSRIYPADEGEVARLEALRTSPEVKTLGRRGASLDIFSPFQRFGEGVHEYVYKTSTALRTFDAATRQTHGSVATLLFVTAMECLATPRRPWRTRRFTVRFCTFFGDLIPETLDRVIAHNAFEGSFRIARGDRSARALRRELLNKIYSFRSNYAHEGIALGYQPEGIFHDLAEINRLTVVRWLSEMAIVNFLKIPRSSLIGRPDLDAGPP